ncbi:hypothetical protein LTR08_003608 [Meristemomyces frigidus]|nr:hypothetical protein LTR08_003608 [Meristemomyces frigidus]
MAENTVRDRERSSSASLFLPPIRTARYPGDGLDYRRPVMTSAAPFIDLTEDDNSSTHHHEETSRARRLPRFGREVIDVDDDDHVAEEETRPYADRLHTYPSHPSTRPHYSGLRRPAPFRLPIPPAMDNDLEIVAERTFSRPMSRNRQHTPAIANQQRSVSPYVGDANRQPIVDLTNDDDVIITNSRRREGGLNAVRPGTTAGVGTRSEAGPRGYAMDHIANIFRGEGVNLRGRLMQRFGATMGDFDEDEAEEQMMAMDHLEQGHHRHHHIHAYRTPGHFAHHGGGMPAVVMQRIAMPVAMDFDGVGFDMGLAGGNRPPTPPYTPPSEPQTGFTRNPAEDEVVVCPNCGDELAMGDDDVKQQVWAVKGCGHVSVLS